MFEGADSKDPMTTSNVWWMRAVVAAILLAYAGVVSAGVRQSRRCRGSLARSVNYLVNPGLRTSDQCLAKAQAGADCSTLENISETDYHRGIERLGDRIDKVCETTDPVRSNFDDGNIVGLIVPATTTALETNTATIFPAVTTPAGRADRRCRDGVLTARSEGLRRQYDAITNCQRRHDRRATSFGPLAEDCKGAGARITGKVAHAVERACAGSDASRVGSCAPLPGCVADATAATSLALAESTYAITSLCGNGVLDPGEQCDDGNDDSTDACVQCNPAKCADGFVQAGVEECDDGNNDDDDCCTTLCKAPVCGDGIVAQGCEQCDDAVTPGCQACQFIPTACPPSGRIQGTVAVRYDVVGAPALSGVRFGVSYPPAAVGLPNPGGPFVDADRLASLTGQDAFLVAQDRDSNTDGQEDTVDVVFALTNQVFDPGPLVSLSFDCGTGASVVPTEFACTVTQASDVVGNDVTNPGAIPCAVASLVAQ